MSLLISLRRIMSALPCTLSLCIGCATSSVPELPKPMMPHLQAEMFRADFWISRLDNPNEELMSADEIRLYNEKIVGADLGVKDLVRFPAEISGAEIREMIRENTEARVEPGKAFLYRQPVTAEYVGGLEESLNLNALPERKKVAYGIATRRTILRGFPTDERIHYSADDQEFDRLIESAISFGKPMLILHETADRKWKYVRVAEFDGWVKAADIAITVDNSAWKSFVTAPRKLVVLASKLYLGVNPYTSEFSNQQLTMGSAFPLLEGKERPRFVDRMETSGQYVVVLPLRLPDGTLSFHPALIPVSADVQVGYLPFTRANLIRQAFKVQGERYGWGGDFETRDCSLFVGDVYRSMGFAFPRNSRLELALPGREVRFSESDSSRERARMLSEIVPGSMLGWNGHIMLFLGQYDGQSYVIHDGSAFSDRKRRDNEGNLEELPLNQVSVTALATLRATGKTYLDTLTIAKTVR